MTAPDKRRGLGARARRALWDFTEYALCFGVIKGPFYFAMSAVAPNPGGKRISMPVPGSAAQVFVRRGTTDAAVFNDIYRRQEYGWNFAEAPKTIVDAGAYTGLSAVYFATRYPDAQIIAVEPDANNYDLLVANTASFTNVHVIRAALWSESGRVSLTDPGTGAWAFRLGEPEVVRGDAAADAGSSASSVQAITISDIIRDFGLDRIDLLKVDIEGSEKEVFADAAGWIGHVDVICMELHDRFKAGCSRSFFKAVDDFPVELRRGEDILVARDPALLLPTPA